MITSSRPVISILRLALLSWLPSLSILPSTPILTEGSPGCAECPIGELVHALEEGRRDRYSFVAESDEVAVEEEIYRYHGQQGPRFECLEGHSPAVAYAHGPAPGLAHFDGTAMDEPDVDPRLAAP